MMKPQPRRAGDPSAVRNRCLLTVVPNDPAVSNITSVKKSAVNRQSVPTNIARSRGEVRSYHSVVCCTSESFLSFFFFAMVLCVAGGVYVVYIDAASSCFMSQVLFLSLCVLFVTYFLPFIAFSGVSLVYFYPQIFFDIVYTSYTIQSSCSVTR